MPYQTSKQWAAALERAAAAFLTKQGIASTDATAYRLRPKGCRKHGGKCLCVVFGELLEHVRWEQKDPAEVASALLSTMLPEPHGKGRERQSAIA